MQFRALRATAAIALSALLGSAPVPTRADAPSTHSTTRPAAPAATRPAAAAPATRPAPKPALASTRPALPAAPTSVGELKAIERRVKEITAQVSPAVVGVQVGRSQGSGVIISPDGYVLTAAHVSGEPGRTVTLHLSDDRQVRARTLGTDHNIDAGLIKITSDTDRDGAPWPHTDIGISASLAPGQWVLTLGHPGGYQPDRPSVLRLGRVLATRGRAGFVETDCTLVGGDSGGPLFDLDGRVVGIHSRIGPSTLANMHTPVDTYVRTWDRLVKGDTWGGNEYGFLFPRGPMLGIGGDDDEGGRGARIGSIRADGPAAKAGVVPGDVVTGFDGKPVKTMTELAELISRKRPGDEVSLTVLRDGKKLDLKAKLIPRPAE